MRWLFCEPGSEDDIARQGALRRMDLWWRAFQKQSQRIAALFRKETHWDLPEWMDQHLGGLHPDLMWEYGPALETSGDRLVITPEGTRGLRPFVDSLLKRSPEIPAWEFYGYRLPFGIKQADGVLKSRAGGTLKGVRFRAELDHRRLICLTYYFPHERADDEGQCSGESILITELLLGELHFNRWIGTITVCSMLDESAGNALSLDRLSETVEALIDGVRNQLPTVPLVEVSETNGIVYRREPERQDDYIGRDDVLVGSTSQKDVILGLGSCTSFYSGRFSRCNETFAYLKIDGSDGFTGDRFEDRGDLEDAIDAALRNLELGCTFGGATGLRYAYVDLALMDVERSLPVLRQVLRGEVSKRSWLLFGDADLADEWVGVYPDSPPPPMPDNNE